MTPLELLKGWLYCYTPRYMTENYLCREKPTDGTALEDDHIGPHDFILRIKFFNFFGRPLLLRTTQILIGTR